MGKGYIELIHIEKREYVMIEHGPIEASHYVDGNNKWGTEIKQIQCAKKRQNLP
jgi:hypothetical protein